MSQIVRLSSFFLLSFLFFTLVPPKNTIVHGRSLARAFIELQCQSTLYSDLCIRTLSYYVSNFTTSFSHQRLAQIALKVTLDRARSTRDYVTEVGKGLSRTKDYEAMKECLDQINDGVDQLTRSINETSEIKEDGESTDFPWHASNVQTWMSTALTDASSCVDGFSGRAIGGKAKALIKAKVLNLQQVTSNALALFNRFAARYRASHALKPKV